MSSPPYESILVINSLTSLNLYLLYPLVFAKEYPTPFPTTWTSLEMLVLMPAFCLSHRRTVLWFLYHYSPLFLWQLVVDSLLGTKHGSGFLVSRSSKLTVRQTSEKSLGWEEHRLLGGWEEEKHTVVTFRIQWSISSIPDSVEWVKWRETSGFSNYWGNNRTKLILSFKLIKSHHRANACSNYTLSLKNFVRWSFWKRLSPFV